jgi:micrococcal nuclease
VVLASVVPACSPAPKAHGFAAARGTATVARLVDGDTLVLHIGDRDERVRLIGIDTPETKDPRKPVQCYGKEASAQLAALVPPGTAVRVERDAEARDRYGRLLLYVWRVDDGLFVNLRLAQDGAAVQLSIPPNTAHAADFARAVGEARQARRGLWGTCGGPGKPAGDGGG